MEPDPPVVRVWKGESDPVGADAYFRHVTTDVAEALARLPGFLGMTVWRRDVGAVVEFVVTTRWASVAHIERFAGRDIGRAVVEPAARAALTRFDGCVTHYDVAFEWSGAAESNAVDTAATPSRAAAAVPRSGRRAGSRAAPDGGT